MLHICKIHDIFLPLLFRKCLDKLPGQTNQFLHRLPAKFQFLQYFLCGLIKIILPQFLHCLFCLIPQVLRQLPLILLHTVVFFSGQCFWLPAIQQNSAPVKILCFESLFQISSKQKILFQRFSVHIWSTGTVDYFFAPVLQIRDLIQQVSGILPQFFHPYTGHQFFLCPDLICLCTGIQPFQGPGITHGKFIHPKNQFRQHFIAFSGGKALHKTVKTFGSLLVIALKHLFCHILFQQFDLALIRCAKSGIQIDSVKVIPDHIRTESVDCRDLCVVDQRLLSLQMFIFRILFQIIFHRFRQSLPHLSGCCPGKCHDQQLVDIDGTIFSGQFSQDSFYQNSSLTGSCRSTDQDISVPQFNDLLLFRRPLHLHLPSPLSLSFSSTVPHRKMPEVSGNCFPPAFHQIRRFP